jgi:predicted RNA polymerase sigma factor
VACLKTPAGWLYRTARNLAIDALRRERTHAQALPRVAEDAERESWPHEAPLEAHFAGPQAGPERLAAVPPQSVPAGYPGWHAVIGELHFRLGRHSAALRAWREALRFTTARADREFLHRRLAACRPDGGEPATDTAVLE